jgi:hypothetical protein
VTLPIFGFTPGWLVPPRHFDLGDRILAVQRNGIKVSTNVSTLFHARLLDYKVDSDQRRISEEIFHSNRSMSK